MNVPSAVGGIATILDAVKTVLGPNAGQALDDAANTSLSRAAKRAHITTRMYIDGNLAGEEIVNNVSRAAQSLYVSLIMSVYQLNQLVAGGRTITDSLKSISTESLLVYRNTEDDVKDFIGLGLEAISNESANPADLAKQAIEEEQDADKKKALKEKDAEFDKKYRSKGIVAADDSGTIPTGRLLELKFAADKGRELSINVLVQLFPIIIRPSVATQFVKLDALASFGQRWLQWRVGEITLMDFIFSLDLIRQRRSVIRQDTDNVLTDYINDRLKKEGRRWKRLFDILGGLTSGKRTPVSNNLASSIMVFSEDTVLRAKAQTGFDLHNKEDRAKYFSKTFSLMIFVVDTTYNKVTLYLNGLDIKGEYSFDQFKPKGQNNDVTEIMKAIQSISQGRVPTF